MLPYCKNTLYVTLHCLLQLFSYQNKKKFVSLIFLRRTHKSVLIILHNILLTTILHFFGWERIDMKILCEHIKKYDNIDNYDYQGPSATEKDVTGLHREE